MNENKNILVTGLPRSGTSLVLKLMSENENTLCLSEPVWIKKLRFEGQSRSDFVLKLIDKIEEIRNEIKRGNPIELTVKKGTKSIPDNYFIKEGNKQLNLKETKAVNVEHSENLKIVIKSNTLFTVCLPQIIDTNYWDVISIIRNPIYVLMSWRSLDIPISKGKIAIGELYSDEVKEIVKEKNLLIRQVKILDWFFKQYITNTNIILKYEELIQNSNKLFLKLLHIDINSKLKLKSRNNSKHYNSFEKNNIYSTLNEFATSYKKFYKHIL